MHINRKRRNFIIKSYEAAERMGICVKGGKKGPSATLRGLEIKLFLEFWRNLKSLLFYIPDADSVVFAAASWNVM